MGSWQWRGARGGLQGLHARDRRNDGAHQGQQHRRQGRRQLGKLARGEAGTQPHRRRTGYALGGCGGSSSEPPEVTGRRERLSGSCRFRRSTSSKRTTAGRYGGTGAATANRKSRTSAKLQTGTRDTRCSEGKQWRRLWRYTVSICDRLRRWTKKSARSYGKKNRGQRAAARTKGTATAGTATRSPA